MFRIVRDLRDYFDADTVNILERRLGEYLNEAETFIIEENYIDKDWRDEYSIFYSKTFYKNINKLSTRVHIVSDEIENLKKLNSKNYIGYFILRPLHIKDAKLLKIIVEPMKKPLGVNSNEDLYLATCNCVAHIGGLFTPNIRTFPFYQQDSAVTVCAYADMWMLAEYMHRRFGFNRPCIRDFISLTLPFRGRVIPSRGLLAEQMCIIFSTLGYNVSISYGASNDIEERIIKRIDTYLESGLPTILAFDYHVIIVAGHTLNSGDKDYIIFDDSGYHLANLLNLKDDEIPPFASRVSRKALIKKLKETGPYVLAINVEFDKLFYPLNSVEKFVDIFLKDAGIENEITKKRILLADSNEFKMFCSKIGVDAFNDLPLPHYIWVAELYRDDELLCDLILDASAHKCDTNKVRLATWLGNKITFYSGKEAKVDRYPVTYSNLQKIE